MRARGTSSAARSVAANTLFLSLADVVGKLVTFFFMLAAARQLGTAQFGIFSFALAFTSMFAVIPDLGVGQLAVREIARDRSIARRYLGNALALKLIALALAAAAAAVLVKLLGYPPTAVGAVYICTLTLTETAFSLFYRLVFQAFERTVYAAVGRALQIAVLLGGLVLLARSTPSVNGYAWAFAGSIAATAVFSWVATSLFLVRPGIRFELRYWGTMLKAALPFALAALLVAAYYWCGTAVLARVKGDAAVGIYSAAMRLVLGLTFLSSAFAGAMYPQMSRMFAFDRPLTAQALARSVRYMAIVGLPLGVLGATLAAPAVSLLYGPRFAQSAPVLRVLAWWGTLIYLNGILATYFLSADRARVVTVQAAVSLLVNVAMNIALIPAFGAIGTAAALVAAELAGFAFMAAHQLRSEDAVNIRGLAGSLARIAVAALAAAPVAWAAGRWHFVAGLVASLGAYVVLLTMLRTFDKTDVALLRAALRGQD